MLMNLLSLHYFLFNTEIKKKLPFSPSLSTFTLALINLPNKKENKRQFTTLFASLCSSTLKRSIKTLQSDAWINQYF